MRSADASPRIPIAIAHHAAPARSMSGLGDLLGAVEREEERLGLAPGAGTPSARVLHVLTALRQTIENAPAPTMRADEALRAECDTLSREVIALRTEAGRLRAEATGRRGEIEGLASERDEVVRLLAQARDAEAGLRQDRDDALARCDEARRATAELKSALMAVLAMLEARRSTRRTQKRAGDRRAA